jgi:hypothetical protein
VRISTPLNRRDAVSDEGVVPVPAMSRQGVATPLSQSGPGSVKLFKRQFRVIQPGDTAPAPTFWASLRGKGGTGRDGQDWTGLDWTRLDWTGLTPSSLSASCPFRGWKCAQPLPSHRISKHPSTELHKPSSSEWVYPHLTPRTARKHTRLPACPPAR